MVQPKTVIVASTNPVKVEVARRAFAAVFPTEEFVFKEVKSESGVPDQPIGDQTREGAKNRLAFIKQAHPDAHFWISQEGGLFKEADRLYSRAWIMVTDQTGFLAESSTSLFYLPKKIAEYIEQGIELGDANDKFFGSINSKQSTGAVGHLTDNLISRTEYYLQAAIIALSELKHKDWY